MKKKSCDTVPLNTVSVNEATVSHCMITKYFKVYGLTERPVQNFHTNSNRYVPKRPFKPVRTLLAHTVRYTDFIMEKSKHVYLFH
jgi:hypothetical protein